MRHFRASNTTDSIQLENTRHQVISLRIVRVEVESPRREGFGVLDPEVALTCLAFRLAQLLLVHVLLRRRRLRPESLCIHLLCCRRGTVFRRSRTLQKEGRQRFNRWLRVGWHYRPRRERLAEDSCHFVAGTLADVYAVLYDNDEDVALAVEGVEEKVEVRAQERQHATLRVISTTTRIT